MDANDGSTLYLLWTTGDAVTARNMVFMYAGNSLRKGWWERVHMIVWGAATELLATDPAVAEEMRIFLELGGQVSVCRRCAEFINRVDEMEAMEKLGDFKVYYVGEFFTGVIKGGGRLITV